MEKKLNGTPGTDLMAGFGKLTVLVFLLFSSLLYSQEGFGTSVIISIRGNAQIYSSDPDFNQQFILQENTDFNATGSGKVYVFKSKNGSSGKKIVKRKSKASVQTRDQARLERIKQYISDFERQKKSFDLCNINNAPFSRQLPYSSDPNRSYIAPSTVSHDFSKICIFQYKYLISLVLEHLYVWKYYYYNSRSLHFCFTEVFSVRPPPLSVL